MKQVDVDFYSTNNASDLSELTKHYERCADLIEKVYQEFKNNKRKV